MTAPGEPEVLNSGKVTTAGPALARLGVMPTNIYRAAGAASQDGAGSFFSLSKLDDRRAVIGTAADTMWMQPLSDLGDEHRKPLQKVVDRLADMVEALAAKRTSLATLEEDIASATTLTLGSDGNSFDVTGTTTVTGISTTTAGTIINLRASNAFTLQYDATALILWNAQDYSLETGDTVTLLSLGDGNYAEISRTSNNILDDSQWLQNLSLSATVAANALTIALKTKAGSDPSGTDPIRIGFRNSTVTSGTYTFRTVTSATSVVVSSGSSLGFIASQTSRIYVAAIDNDGTVELGVYHPLSQGVSPSLNLSLKGIHEHRLYSSTAEGGAGAADSAQTLYSTTARTNKPVRILGFVDIQTGATVGQWSNSPVLVQVMGPGVLKTGDIVQQIYERDGTVATGTTTMPFDNTAPGPQDSEGDEYLSLSITPTSLANLIEIDALLNVAGSANLTFTAALFSDQDGTNNCIVAHTEDGTDADGPSQISIYAIDTVDAASATAYSVRAGLSGAGTLSFNGTAGAGIHAGYEQSYIKLLERFV